MPKRIHAARGLFSLSGGKVLTWCGRRVDDDQLAIITTDREVNCMACARTKRGRRWLLDHLTKQKPV